MDTIISFISQPWPWYVAGPMIAGVMFLLLYFGKTFGLSSNLRSMCTIGGAGKCAAFFDFDWKKQSWNLIFVLGSITGGFLSSQYLMDSGEIALAPAVVTELKALGIEDPGGEYLPSEIFSFEGLLTARGFIMLVLGGFFVGFGARYAGGCTSGHAITGLSNLQWPSLIAVIGFFIGGLIVIHFVLPYVLTM